MKCTVLGARVASGKLDNGQPWQNLVLGTYRKPLKPDVYGYEIKEYSVPWRLWEAAASAAGVDVAGLINRQINIELDSVGASKKAVAVVFEVLPQK
jgi:hypothetical protein